MCGVGIDIEFAFALELGVSLIDETALLFAPGAVGESVDCTLLHADVDALAVLYVDGRSGRVGKCEPIEFHGGLVAAFHVEFAVGR